MSRLCDHSSSRRKCLRAPVKQSRVPNSRRRVIRISIPNCPPGLKSHNTFAHQNRNAPANMSTIAEDDPTGPVTDAPGASPGSANGDADSEVGGSTQTRRRSGRVVRKPVLPYSQIQETGRASSKRKRTEAEDNEDASGSEEGGDEEDSSEEESGSEEEEERPKKRGPKPKGAKKGRPAKNTSPKPAPKKTKTAAGPKPVKKAAGPKTKKAASKKTAAPLSNGNGVTSTEENALYRKN